MATYNGHRSWNAWNVSLWIGNDEGLYNLALRCLQRTNRNVRGNRQAAKDFISFMGGPQAKTPDGAVYNYKCVWEALQGLRD